MIQPGWKHFIKKCMLSLRTGSVLYYFLFVFGAWLPDCLNPFHINGITRCIRLSYAQRGDEFNSVVNQIFGEE